jgi:hypothetical protein
MIRKLLLVAIVLLLIGTAGLFLFARSVLSPDSVRATLEQQLSSRSGQAVRIGSARAAIFPRVALELGDVTIGEAAEISVNRITIATGLRGLFNRRVEDAEVVLSGGRLTLPAALALVPSSIQSAPSEPGTGFTVASVRVISLRDVAIVVGSTSLQIDLESALEGDRLDVSRLAARSDGTRLDATGALTSVSALQGKFTVAADLLDVDELLTLASGATNTSAAARGEPRAPSAIPMRVALDIKATAGRFAGYGFSNLSATLEAIPAHVTMPNLGLGMFGGTFSGSLDLDSSRATPRIQVRGTIAGIDVGQLAASAGAPGSITGRLAGTVALSADATDADSMLRTARGTATATATDGVIPQLDMVRSIVLAFGKPTGAPPPGSGSAFTRLGGDFKLQNGSLHSDSLAMHSRDFDLSGRATLAVPGGALDAVADVMLSEELTSQSGTDLRRYAQENGRVVVPARVSGTIGQPSVALDMTAAARRAFENEVKRKTRGLLEGLFKKKR